MFMNIFDMNVYCPQRSNATRKKELALSILVHSTKNSELMVN